jgi:hypothetical protein
MFHLTLIVRIAGVLLTLFLISSVFFAIDGALYSDEAPPLTQRVLSALPAASLSLLLLMPQRLFIKRFHYNLLRAAYALACLVVLAVAVSGIRRYMLGDAHWGIILSGLILPLIVSLNGLVLFAQKPPAAT